MSVQSSTTQGELPVDLSWSSIQSSSQFTDPSSASTSHWWSSSTPLQEAPWQFAQRSSGVGAIAFIDSTVADYQSLAAGITPGTAVYVLDPLQDAVTQITQTLLRHSGISSVHILSHGSAGSLQLGGTTLDFQNLDRYSSQLQSWSQVLTDDADLLLYGCDVGAGAVGAAFLQQVARLTGADLAASNDVTGNTALGGDWELEVNTGEIATSLIFQAAALTNYQFVLPSQLVSVVGATQGNGNAWNTNLSTGDWSRDVMNSSLQSMSDDGRYVVFVSTATNLGFDDQNGNQQDVFLRDRLTGETILVSSVYNASQGNNNTNRTDFAQSYNPVISADGRYVAFVSEAPNLVGGGADENGYTADVFLWDRDTRKTTLVSRRNSNGRSTYGQSIYPSISRDGRRVSFSSLGYDLTTFEGYDWHVYAYTWSGTPDTGSLVRVSVNNSGQVGNNQSANEYPALISGNGRYVVFSTRATNMIDLNNDGTPDPDNSPSFDIYVRDLDANQTILVNVNASGTGNSNQRAIRPTISDDGRYVAFISYATDLVPGANSDSGFRHAYVRDLVTNTTQLVSVNNSGVPSTGWSDFAVISGDGRSVAFTSDGGNLASFAGAIGRNVYVRNLATNTTSLVSVNQTGTGYGNAASDSVENTIPSLSFDGRYVAFTSTASNLAPNDTNGTRDVFLRDLVANTTTLVSQNFSGTGSANAGSNYAVVSRNGSVVLFTSAATNLVNTDTNGFQDVFVFTGNQSPIANNDSFGTNEDTVLNNTVLTNDSDPDGNTPLTVSLVTGPGNGSLSLNSNGTFSYTPNANFNGTDTFTYSVRDSLGANSSPASVVLSITAVNDAPVAVNDSFGTNEDTVLNNTVLTNDSDLENNTPLTVSLVTGPSNGSLSLNSNGTFSYTPNANFNGTDTFTYSVRDSLGANSSPASVVLSITAVNDAPVAVNDSFGTNEDTVLSNTVLTNDSDLENNTPLTVSLVAGPSNGSLSLNSNGTFSYTPNANYNGTDTFTYSVRDSLGANSNPASVVLSITAVNDAPAAVNDNYTLATGAAFNVAASGVLANDTDIDTPLANVSANLVSSTSNGVLNFNANGSFTYTPNIGFTGTDSFTYRANDGSLNSGLATVNLSVTAVPNATPVANNDSFGTNEDTVLSNTVLTNDSDPDGNTPLTASLVTGPSNGSLSLNSNGTFSYTPNANYNGTDTFTYSVRDSLGANSNPASVVLSVTAVNDAPVAVNDNYTISNTATLNVAAAGILANDTDIDTAASSLTASLATATTNGVITLNLDGSFTYTPNMGFIGTDSFTYRANDGSLNSGLATVTLSVTGITNAAPIASNDTASGNEDTAISGNVLSNDSDPDGNTPLTATVVAGPSNGSLSLNPDGTFSYTPNANFNGSDTFTYFNRDALSAASNTATVVLTVNSVNDAPSFVVGANQSAIAGAGTQTVNNWATGFNPGAANESGQTVAGYTVVSNSNPSIFATAPSINSAGTLTYTPVAAIANSTSAVIGVRVQDTGGTANGGTDLSATQFFTVTVTPQATLSITGVSQSEGNSGNTPYNFTVSLSAASSQTVSVNYATADGTAQVADNDYVAANGTLVFLPGETSKVIAVNGIGDTKLETNETFTVNLSAPTNAALSTTSATGTITNDDAQPTIRITGTNQAEGNLGQTRFVFTVSLSNASSQTVSVNYTTEDGTATTIDNDYLAASGTVVFAPGETSKTIAIDGIGDKKTESNETFAVKLSNPSNGAIATASAFGTIVNDDNAVLADFNGDGTNDIVWRNAYTGENMIWLMGNTLPISTIALPWVRTDWVLEGVGDFNKDGNPDILWREYIYGVSGVWTMSGGSVVSFELLPQVTTNWAIDGVSDFNGDGNADILWRDYNTGHMGIWYMDGTALASTDFLGYIPAEWLIQTIADVNNDGKVDLVWRNQSTGATASWLMYGNPGFLFYTAVALPGPTGANWDIAATGDYNRDGKTDFIWRNHASGTNSIWFMDGTSSVGQVPTNSLSSEWYTA